MMFAHRFARHIRSSLWFVPVVCVVAGAVLSFGTIWLDLQHGVDAAGLDRRDVAFALVPDPPGIGVTAGRSDDAPEAADRVSFELSDASLG